MAFEQLDVEFPADWSVTASNIVAQKYFRGGEANGGRERSLRRTLRQASAADDPASRRSRTARTRRSSAGP